MLDSDKNTWIGGMDQDTSKSKFQPNKYYELRNAHIVTHEGLSTGSIENEKGTLLNITLPAIGSSASLGLTNVTFSAQAQADIKIIGWTFYRDDLIVISTTSDGVTDNVGHIWLIPFNIGTGKLSNPIPDAPSNNSIVDIIPGDPLYGTGNYVDPGSHSYYMTCINDKGIESCVSLPSNVFTLLDSPPLTNRQKIIVNIPLGISDTVSRKLYRTIAGNTTPKLVTTITNNTATTFTDYIRDSALTTTMPTLTERQVTVNEHLRYVGALNLNPNNRIRKIIPRYEFGTSILGGLYKIYWTDGKNLIRHLNLYESIHYHTGTNIIDINVNNLEVLPYIGYQAPITLDKVITGGNFKAGMVQYAYQFYKLYGVETKYSPASKLIHLTSYNEYSTDSSNYFGVPIDTYTGKAVKIHIPAVNSAIFDRVRVISLFYNSYNSTPKIKVIADITALNSIVSITDIDTDTIDIPPTLEEYTTLGGNIFACQDMEVKDNRLIPANISTLPGFDIASTVWDSRAYRFYSNRLAQIYTSSKVFERIVSSSNWGTVPATSDCYNLFNEIKQGNDSDTSLEYMYQEDGDTLGGEGPNLKYEFIIKTVELDEGNEVQGDSATIGRIQTILNTNTDQSYTNYASPYIHSEFVGYHRDEIYAFAIEWFDQYGRQSFASWIGDIRFPRIYDVSLITPTYLKRPITAGQFQITTVYTGQFTPYSYFSIIIAFNGVNVSYTSTVLYDGTNLAAVVADFNTLLFTNDNYYGSITIYHDISYGDEIRFVLSKPDGPFTIGLASNMNILSNVTTQTWIAAYAGEFDYSPSFKADDGKNYANILGIKFTIKQAPAGVTAFRIVRCPVTQADRTISFQGLMEPTIYNSSDPLLINYPFPHLLTIDSLYDGSFYPYDSYNFKLLNISTPDPTFFKDSFTFQANDFVTLPAIYDGDVTTYFKQTSRVYSKLTSIKTYTSINSITPKANEYNVIDAKNVIPSEYNDSYIRVGNYNFLNYYATHNSLNTLVYGGYRGSNIVVNIDSDFAVEPSSGGIPGFYIANYKRSITPYGGASYATRTQRYYIPCSDVTSIVASSTNTSIYVYGGDTYISYFSYLRNYTDYAKAILNYVTSADSLYKSSDSNCNSWIGFPVETRLNLDLRHDKLLQWYKRSLPENDNKTVASVTMNAGSNIITSPTNIFSMADIGKNIRIDNVGTGGTVPMVGVIIGYTSALVVTVSFDALHSFVGAYTVFASLTSPYWVLNETQAKGLQTFPNYYPEDVKDLYLYNSVYSKENDVNKYYPKPLNFQEVTQYGTRIKASEKRISGNTIDQWLKFPSNLYKDVDSPYGDITTLKLFKDQLFFFQDSGFGIQPVNERSTTVDESGTQIVLGQGEILGKYGYISRITGCKHQASVVTTEDQMHFFDIRLKRWNVYNGQTPLPLSSVSGLHSYFQDEVYSQYTNLTVDNITAIAPRGIHGVYDTQNNRVLMTILSNGFAETLSYNLFTNTYEAFFDFAPTLYLSACDRVLAVSNETTGRGLIYKLNDGDYGKYFGSSTYKDTTVQFLVNKNPENVKIFNNLDYNSFIEINGVEVFTGNIPNTLTSIQVTNDNQDTGLCNLFIFGNTGTPGTTDVITRRRFRTWHLKFPRSIAMKTGDRTDARLHGQYILVTLKFTNNGNKRLILHDVTTHFNVT
jgi:hypothetical protein